MTAITKRKKPLAITKTDWIVLGGLLFLCLVPSIAGTVRITQLTTGAEITEDNARFFAMPIPVIFHIIGSILYSVIGAFQFSKGFRHWKPRLHRILGRYVLLPSGIFVAISGLWMTLYYDLPEIDGDILNIERLITGVLMLAFLIIGYVTARNKQFKQHGYWMIRAYAPGMGAGTQVFTIMLGTLMFGGRYDVFTRAIYMGAGWLINIIVAEWVIYNQKSAKARKTSLKLSQS